MKRIKIISSILFATILLATQVFVVGAAPVIQESPPITGSAVDITLDIDPDNGVTTVVVILDVGAETYETVRLSLADATDLGLLNDDGTVNEDAKGTTIEIDPSKVIPDVPEEPPVEGKQHPVGSALSDFFSDLLGVDYETIMEYHEEGVGFGVIAQALWMTKALEGDSETFAAILEARQNRDYSGIELPDGSTPQNWGQFRKALLKDPEKAKQNLGAIMSGRTDDDPSNQPPTNANGNQPDKDKNKDKGNHGKGNDKDKGKDKGKNKY
jgi:hypothetical protein